MLSTNVATSVDFIMIPADGCDGCTNDASL